MDTVLTYFLALAMIQCSTRAATFPTLAVMVDSWVDLAITTTSIHTMATVLIGTTIQLTTVITTDTSMVNGIPLDRHLP